MARQWRQQGVEQGIERGVEQGIRQGLAQQRELLRDQAEARFGTLTAERLSASLQQEEDPQAAGRDCLGRRAVRDGRGSAARSSPSERVILR